MDRLEELGDIVQDIFQNSEIKRELDELIAKVNAQLQAEPQSRAQIMEQLVKDFYAIAGRHEVVGWTDGAWTAWNKELESRPK